jgi:hypothetical protein
MKQFKAWFIKDGKIFTKHGNNLKEVKGIKFIVDGIDRDRQYILDNATESEAPAKESKPSPKMDKIKKIAEKKKSKIIEKAEDLPAEEKLDLAETLQEKAIEDMTGNPVEESYEGPSMIVTNASPTLTIPDFSKGSTAKMTASEVIERFEDHLTDKEKEELKSVANTYGGNTKEVVMIVPTHGDIIYPKKKSKPGRPKGFKVAESTRKMLSEAMKGKYCKSITYEGRAYASIKEMAISLGINYQTAASRLRKLK